jgi:hypothetical protein
MRCIASARFDALAGQFSVASACAALIGESAGRGGMAFTFSAADWTVSLYLVPSAHIAVSGPCGER